MGIYRCLIGSSYVDRNNDWKTRYVYEKDEGDTYLGFRLVRKVI